MDPQPVMLPHPGRIVVIGDVHGDLDRLIYCLVNMNIFSRDLVWIAEPPSTVVVQLGDQVDSIPRGGDYEWDKGKIDINVVLAMDRLDSIAKSAGGGGRVLSIIGNHEMMNAFKHFVMVSPSSLQATGGIDGRSALFEPGKGRIALSLANRNVIARVGPYLFCHGGLLYSHLKALYDQGISDVNEMNIINRKYLMGEDMTTVEIELFKTTVVGDDGILWTRKYLDDKNPLRKNELEVVLKATGCLSMFVGHNVVENIVSIEDNKLFFVDAGLSRAFGTTTIQVLNIQNTASGVDIITRIEFKVGP